MEFIKKHWKIIAGIAVLIIAALWAFRKFGGSGTPEAKLAKCLKDKGAKFYGASWCGHCKAQKATFGDAAKFLPYIECSINGTKNQKQSCTDAGVKGYPMWTFADGTTQNGEMTMDQLREKTGC